MEAFKRIESILVILSILGLTLLLATLSSSRWADPISLTIIIAFIVWGFRLRRKLHTNIETDEDAFLWLEVIIYTGLMIFPIAETVTQYFELPDAFKTTLITAYIAFPFLGASLSLLRLRRNIKN